MRILGIDPGLRLTGYALLALNPTQPTAEPELVEAGVIRLDGKQSVEDRLVVLHHDLTELIEQLKPTRLAVEQLYAHYKHPRTAIIMGHARGVMLLAARQHNLIVEHLPSTEVKKAITGNGHASKEQIQLAVQTTFNLPEPPSPPDVADAIAIALCHTRRLIYEQL